MELFSIRIQRTFQLVSTVLFKHNITICNFWQFITLRRKNYFFCGNHKATVCMSFVCSRLAICKSHNVAPKDYLNDIITPISYHKKTAMRNS